MRKGQTNSYLLLKNMWNGSKKDFQLFYEKYNLFVFSTALKILKNSQEAEDICHDVFIEVIKKPNSYDPLRGSVEAWLAVKTRSRCLDLLRRKREIPVDEHIEKQPIPPFFEQKTIEEKVMENIDRSIIYTAVNQLPVAQKKAIYGNFFQNIPHRELATQLQVPLGTVKSLVRYGINKLRKQLLHEKSLNSFKGDDAHDV